MMFYFTPFIYEFINLTSTSLLTWWNLVSNDSQQLHRQNKGLQTSHAEADTLIIQ